MLENIVVFNFYPLFSYVPSNVQGLKRSVTTLRGGSLGYAEIVAVKVYKPNKKNIYSKFQFFSVYFGVVVLVPAQI